MVLKVNSVTSISNSAMQKFMQDGIALVRVEPKLIQQMKAVEQGAKQFFRQPTSVKTMEKFNEAREGYLDQRTKGYYIERYITRGQRQPPEPLQAHFEAMLTIRDVFALEIMLPLIQKIFTKLSIEQHFAEIEGNPDYTLSLIYYPPGDFEKERLAPHQDTALMTALWTQAAGYRAKLKGQWQAIMPHDDYVIVQIGKGLKLMTGGQCHAIEHDVTVNETIERFSMASFVTPNNHVPFRDYVNDKLIEPSFIDYVKKDLAKIYKEK